MPVPLDAARSLTESQPKASTISKFSDFLACLQSCRVDLFDGELLASMIIRTAIDHMNSSSDCLVGPGAVTRIESLPLY